MKNFDYIIVGAGSAGSVVARRLSDHTSSSVLLLEAGPNDNSWMIKIPIGYGKLFYDSRFNWKFSTEPEKQLDNRKIYWPRGKVLGGSSSINAMVFVRGHPNDFDEWGMVAQGWSWSTIAPYFRKMENWSGAPCKERGNNGPLSVKDVSNQIHPLTKAYLAAAQEYGIPISEDYNGVNMEGACVYQITTQDGYRCSTASAYLQSSSKKKINLNILTNTQVTRIIFEDKRAIGIECLHKGKAKRFYAHKEIIVSAGSIQSPHLLQLSGVGPARLLRNHGVGVVIDSPSVGRHLKDHLGIDFTLSVNTPSLNQNLRPLMGKVKLGFEYLINKTGALSMSLNQGGGFVKSDQKLSFPDLQLYFSPLSYSKAPKGTRPLMSPDPFPAVRLGFNPCKPTSEGVVELNSSDPLVPPKMIGNYLDSQYDQEIMLRGIRLIRDLIGMPSFQDVLRDEISPGKQVRSDSELRHFVSQNADTVYHQCGTCRMGADIKKSVVDAKLNVHGLSGLKVVDASIFPTIPSGNTNAPAIVVGEKAADIILEKP